MTALCGRTGQDGQSGQSGLKGLRRPKGSTRDDYQGEIMAADHPLILWPPDKPLSESPGPVVDGAPVGILPAETFAHCDLWRRALDVTRPETPLMATLAMGTSPFLEKSDALRQTLQQAFPDHVVHNWQADMIDREALANALTTGPELAIYTGHGRMNGWSGYQVTKWSTIKQAKKGVPIGALMHFSCSAMAGRKSGESFGAKWVLSGRALSSFGATSAIKTTDLCALIDVFIVVLESRKPRHLGDWLVAVDALLRQSRSLGYLMKTFGKFRLLGAARPF
jgi:hypothetical protein